MKPEKTPAYWPTRILFAVAIIATAIVVAFPLWSAFLTQGTMGGGPIEWELPTNVAFFIAAAAIAIIGLIWAIRIFRGPRDEPPPWQHRDH